MPGAPTTIKGSETPIRCPAPGTQPRDRACGAIGLFGQPFDQFAKCVNCVIHNTQCVTYNTLVSSRTLRYVSRMTHDTDRHLKEALGQYVQQEGLRPTARRTGIPLGVIRAIIEDRDVSGANLRLATEKLGLEFYIGPKREYFAGREEPAPVELAQVDRFSLAVSAGPGASEVAMPDETVPFAAQHLRRHKIKPAEVAVLDVRGDSMEPILFDGDTILVDKVKSRPVSGKMYVVVRPENVQVKWVIVTRRAITLVSENEAYPPERVDPHDNAEFYRVRWFGHFIR